MTKLLMLFLIVGLLSACVGADGKRYVLAEENAIQKAQTDGAFVMCLGLVAQEIGPIVPPSPENLSGVLGYCANAVVELYGTESIAPQPEKLSTEKEK